MEDFYKGFAKRARDLAEKTATRAGREVRQKRTIRERPSIACFTERGLDGPGARAVAAQRVPQVDRCSVEAHARRGSSRSIDEEGTETTATPATT